jgi:hypothetical protein
MQCREPPGGRMGVGGPQLDLTFGTLLRVKRSCLQKMWKSPNTQHLAPKIQRGKAKVRSTHARMVPSVGAGVHHTVREPQLVVDLRDTRGHITER